ncbi:hypothetical protein CEXT_351341 [Caerostris extrusa]|uniref:Maturase K n=1 Tax=Caerostris extrusa TaxID=172846 RepID=A0AAV4RN07_CAEEX|nr:hypothetical protein CEXT_351341 [Caerostris extrusa]
MTDEICVFFFLCLVNGFAGGKRRKKHHDLFEFKQFEYSAERFGISSFQPLLFSAEFSDISSLYQYQLFSQYPSVQNFLVFPTLKEEGTIIEKIVAYERNTQSIFPEYSEKIRPIREHRQDTPLGYVSQTTLYSRPLSLIIPELFLSIPIPDDIKRKSIARSLQLFGDFDPIFPGLSPLTALTSHKNSVPSETFNWMESRGESGSE